MIYYEPMGVVIEGDIPDDLNDIEDITRYLIEQGMEPVAVLERMTDAMSCEIRLFDAPQVAKVFAVLLDSGMDKSEIKKWIDCHPYCILIEDIILESELWSAFVRREDYISRYITCERMYRLVCGVDEFTPLLSYEEVFLYGKMEDLKALEGNAVRFSECIQSFVKEKFLGAFMKKYILECGYTEDGYSEIPIVLLRMWYDQYSNTSHIRQDIIDVERAFTSAIRAELVLLVILECANVVSGAGAMSEKTTEQVWQYVLKSIAAAKSRDIDSGSINMDMIGEFPALNQDRAKQLYLEVTKNEAINQKANTMSETMYAVYPVVDQTTFDIWCKEQAGRFGQAWLDELIRTL